MNQYGFAIRWSDEDAEYIALCPEFPGVSALGATAEEALREVQVALDLVIEDMVEDGCPLPAPQTMPRHADRSSAT